MHARTARPHPHSSAAGGRRHRSVGVGAPGGRRPTVRLRHSGLWPANSGRPEQSQGDNDDSDSQISRCRSGRKRKGGMAARTVSSRRQLYRYIRVLLARPRPLPPLPPLVSPTGVVVPSVLRSYSGTIYGERIVVCFYNSIHSVDCGK